ncbi:MAG: hypothetical protein SFY80_05275 [Verrucomicrobiota bacterium]|nr:hypothetical protein [Verrucomicrobiota bacterium]
MATFLSIETDAAVETSILLFIGSMSRYLSAFLAGFGNTDRGPANRVGEPVLRANAPATPIDFIDPIDSILHFPFSILSITFYAQSLLQ